MSTKHPFNKHPSAVIKSVSAQLARDVAAFDVICAARPLKAPPLRLAPAVRSPGALALLRDIRLGVAA